MEEFNVNYILARAVPPELDATDSNHTGVGYATYDSLFGKPYSVLVKKSVGYTEIRKTPDYRISGGVIPHTIINYNKKGHPAGLRLYDVAKNYERLKEERALMDDEHYLHMDDEKYEPLVTYKLEDTKYWSRFYNKMHADRFNQKPDHEYLKDKLQEMETLPDIEARTVKTGSEYMNNMLDLVRGKPLFTRHDALKNETTSYRFKKDTPHYKFVRQQKARL